MPIRKSLADQRPKTMVEIAGRPLLQHIVDAYNTAGVKDICVVRGYCKEAVNLLNLRYVDNDDFADTSELVSLGLALDLHTDDAADLLISYGDVMFSPGLLVRQKAFATGRCVMIGTVASGKLEAALWAVRISHRDDRMALRTFLCRRLAVAVSAVGADAKLIHRTVTEHVSAEVQDLAVGLAGIQSKASSDHLIIETR